MRKRVLGGRTDIKRAVIEVSRDLDGRVTEPLEIAVGDRLRIGATHWDKQLFNGTIVTVEDLEVLYEKGRNASGPARTGKGDESEVEPGAEPSVLITARTDDARRVAFRHDEIRDYKENIRLDYGYAMTIASAQGLTVDRAFLLVEDRPARETIYPAATRHREGLDIYVNRSPLAFDIADRRPEDQADMPVTDSDVRAYLAVRWSRSQPKEAALDYVADDAWRDAREGARADIRNGRSRPRGAEQVGPGDRQEGTAETQAAANDNAIVRIAQEIRHAVNGWRHGAAVDAFATERTEVLAAWDDLRERARDEGEAVALSPVFRETLERHGALVKRAAMFRARPQVFERLLVGRAGIGERDMEELGEVHARARSYHRSVAGKATHARQAPQPEQARPDTVVVDASAYTPEPHPDEHAHLQSSTPTPSDRDLDTEPSWETAYDRLELDWIDLVAVANRARLPLPLVRGYDELIVRLQNLVEDPQLPSNEQQELMALLDYHRRETAARTAVDEYLSAAERHVKACEPLQREAESQGVHVAEVAGWPEWRQEAQRLEKAGRAILADEDTYGAYLDAVAAGKPRGRLTVDQLRTRLEDGRVDAVTREEPEAHRNPALEQQDGIAYILEDLDKLRQLREQLKKRERKIGRQHKKSRGLSM